MTGWHQFFRSCEPGEEYVLRALDAHIRRRLRAILLHHWMRQAGFDRSSGTGIVSWRKGSSDLMARPKKYPDELIQRGVRLALESARPIAHVAGDLGIHPETLRKKVRRAQADRGARPDLPTSSERDEIKKLRAENFELRRANEILNPPACFSRRNSTRTDEVSRYIDDHRGRFGVEPICRVLEPRRRPPTTTAPAVSALSA